MPFMRPLEQIETDLYLTWSFMNNQIELDGKSR